jgi:2-amino-4-hydroxy-6-hydroxymethyldihydropteridine diphosphokinase
LRVNRCDEEQVSPPPAETRRRGRCGGRAILGLGANLGAPEEQIASAIDRLRELLDGLVVSRLYRSAPLGYRDQPDFVNCVCAGHSKLNARQLLREAQRIEDALRRTRSFRNAPRTIDIDLLAFDELVLRSSALTLPHPRLHERAFVLVPLAEVAPEWRHPLLGLTAAELLRGLPAAQLAGLVPLR